MLPSCGGWSLNEAILSAGQTYRRQPARAARADPVLLALPRRRDGRGGAGGARRQRARTPPRSRTASCGPPGWRATAPASPTTRWPQALYANLEEVGRSAPTTTTRSPSPARSSQELGIEPMDAAVPGRVRVRWSRRRTPSGSCASHMPAWQRNWTSDDYVEMSWYAPTVRVLHRPAGARARPRRAAAYPGWVMNALGGIPATIDPTVVCAAKTVAGTLLDLLGDPAMLAAARSSSRRARGGHRRVRSCRPTSRRRWSCPGPST